MVERLSMSCDRSRHAQCSQAALMILLLVGPVMALGHGHGVVEVDDGDCAVCLHQQSEWFPEIGAPTLVPDRAVEARGVAANEQVAVDRWFLSEPLRGPPALT